MVSKSSSETNQHPTSPRQGVDGSSMEEHGIQPFIGVDASEQANSCVDKTLAQS